MIIFRADWKNYGKSAGFIRNGNIADKSDILIAIVAKDRKGGTEDTIRKAKKIGKKVIIIEDLCEEEDITNFDPLLEI